MRKHKLQSFVILLAASLLLGGCEGVESSSSGYVPANLNSLYPTPPSGFARKYTCKFCGYSTFDANDSFNHMFQRHPEKFRK